MSIQSFADITLQLFELNCPQLIGSLTSFTAKTNKGEDEIAVGACIHPESDGFHDRASFKNIHEYFEWIISLKESRLHQASYASQDQSRLAHVWTRLRSLVTRESSKLSPSSLRVVPVNEDFAAHNVVIHDDGRIAGVYDWEYHALLPAALAAEYPEWINYTGVHDPRFKPVGSTLSYFWHSSPDSARRLRLEFDMVRPVLENHVDQQALDTEADCTSKEPMLSHRTAGRRYTPSGSRMDDLRRSTSNGCRDRGMASGRRDDGVEDRSGATRFLVITSIHPSTPRS
jgi:hypothetical protein